MNNEHIKEAIRQYIKDEQPPDSDLIWCDRAALIDMVSNENNWPREVVDYSLWELLEIGEVVWEDTNHWAVCLREIANPPVEGYGEG